MKLNIKILYLKIKSVLLLLVIFTILILLITIISHRPYILKVVSYKYPEAKKFSRRSPSSFLLNYKPKNESYCKFNYNLPEQFVYDDSEIKFSPESGAQGPHKVLYNVIEAKPNYNSTALLTYSTHVTPDFIRYISEIVRYWDGFVSLAAFVPDFDADTVTKLLTILCHCLPEMSKLSVHYVFPINKPPFVGSNIKNIEDCTLPDISNDFTFRHQNKLPYPVNVCRNVARHAASTEFVLVSDVELMPSENLASKFLKMTEKNFINSHFRFPSKVFVIPVFEIESYESIPRSKSDMIQLIQEEKAVYFHRYVCSHCQRFPGLEQWLKIPNEDVKPLLAVKREYPFHRWEPIYIGTKREPLYSEVLSWEGKQDKMIQMLEMCLIGYNFIILDGAFLVHWPGIKKKNYEIGVNNQWRSKFFFKNSRQYKVIIKKLAVRYKKNPRCKLQ